MTQFSFGSGTLILKRTDLADTPPALLGTLQEVDVDFDRKIETLLGQYNMTVAAAGGEFKITGKAKFARLNATQFGNIFLGPNVSASNSPAMTEITGTGETDTVASSSITVTNSGTFVEDLGVFAANGTQLTPVASAPVAGVSYVPGAAGIGTYDFASGDNSTAYTIYYAYTISSSGTQLTLANTLMGPLPTFELYLKESFNYFGAQKDLVIKLNAAVSSKLSLPFANSKFTVAELDFQALADASNNIGSISLTDRRA